MQRQDFAWVQGELVRYRSSASAERGFCSVCGSTVSMHEEVLTDRVQVTVGSLDQPQRGSITDHLWTQQQIPWFHVSDQLPRFPQSSSAVPTKARNDGAEV
ncbi:MAG: hypothetical protein HC921_18750 [Synechococcaceae cyanobacterium SM2_3_1]|nr:hypothetical protein [Synechococcaceae cyanobacterium SM2_3_1]